jgi:hypothetical protein
MKLWLTALGVGVLVVRMSVAAPTVSARTRGFSVPPASPSSRCWSAQRLSSGPSSTTLPIPYVDTHKAELVFRHKMLRLLRGKHAKRALIESGGREARMPDMYLTSYGLHVIVQA